MQAIVELILGVIVTIVVLLICAQDRLDGDELWKGLASGATCVAAIKAAQSDAVRHLLKRQP